MGCICTKKEQNELQPEPQAGADHFYVETKLDDIPEWAELEWHNSL